MAEARDIGLDVAAPEGTCEDDRCPFHGTLPVRGRIMEGEVESVKMDKTAVVTREYAHHLPKYERYERRNSRISVHNPACLDIDEGDRVKIAECRPLSKTKKFVIVERLEE
ncbi:MAG: 30S ribosomal protein S17 [Candidatus Nanohaloarchaea archaeon]|nr:30S ribosomal protein S17 [Candidatus Nanohaloarchaea archaeon]